MAYTGAVAARPTSIGCLQTFKKSFKESVIRTEAENSAFIKVRRRTSSPIAVADCSLTIPATTVPDFESWYLVNCQCGTIPTRIKVPPSSTEEIWRFSSPPQIDWIDKNAATVTWSMEQLPLWRA